MARTSLSQAAAMWMVRDLINTPANLLGPVELADFAVSLADRYGAVSVVSADVALEETYPAIAAVGRGSTRPPRVVTFRWRGRSATEASPLSVVVRQGRLFRHRRIRPEAVGWYAAYEKGHGRGRHRARARAASLWSRICPFD